MNYLPITAGCVLSSVDLKLLHAPGISCLKQLACSNISLFTLLINFFPIHCFYNLAQISDVIIGRLVAFPTLLEPRTILFGLVTFKSGF